MILVKVESESSPMECLRQTPSIPLCEPVFFRSLDQVRNRAASAPPLSRPSHVSSFSPRRGRRPAGAPPPALAVARRLRRWHRPPGAAVHGGRRLHQHLRGGLQGSTGLLKSWNIYQREVMGGLSWYILILKLYPCLSQIEDWLSTGHLSGSHVRWCATIMVAKRIIER